MLILKAPVKTGVIYAGANRGQELPDLRKVFSPIVLIEPLAHDLPDDCTVIRCALGESEGTAQFNVASWDQSSSLKAMTGHRQHYPWVADSFITEVEVRRLDELAREHPEIGQCNCLCLDIQGCEYEALQGSVDTLKRIDAVQVECAIAELYEDQVLLDGMTEFMKSQGFALVEWSMHSAVEGDVLYVR